MVVTGNPTIGAPVDIPGLTPADPAAAAPARGDPRPHPDTTGAGDDDPSGSGGGPVVVVTTDPEAQTDDPLINPTKS